MASTLFLKPPKRIMALMAVMTPCLMVYAALEHRILPGNYPQSRYPIPQRHRHSDR